MPPISSNYVLSHEGGETAVQLAMPRSSTWTVSGSVSGHVSDGADLGLSSATQPETVIISISIIVIIIIIIINFPFSAYAVAAQGCLPPGANICVAAPGIQISSAIKEFLRILDMGVWTNPWDPLLFRPILFSPLPSLPCKLPQRGPGQSPGRYWIQYIVALKSGFWWQHI